MFSAQPRVFVYPVWRLFCSWLSSNVNKLLTRLLVKKVYSLRKDMRISLIVAGCQVKGKEKLGIGFGGKLPWRLKSEMKHFTSLTKSGEGKKAVLMGRKTWESIPVKFRPLSERFNVIITKQIDYQANSDQAKIFNSIEGSLKHLENEGFETCWIIGGSEIYNYFIEKQVWDRIYLTRIQSEFPCDTFFPSSFENSREIHDLDLVSKDIQEENDIKYSFHIYERIK